MHATSTMPSGISASSTTAVLQFQQQFSLTAHTGTLALFLLIPCCRHLVCDRPSLVACSCLAFAFLASSSVAVSYLCDPFTLLSPHSHSAFLLRKMRESVASALACSLSFHFFSPLLLILQLPHPLFRVSPLLGMAA